MIIAHYYGLDRQLLNLSIEILRGRMAFGSGCASDPVQGQQRDHVVFGINLVYTKGERSQNLHL